jgi:hypothetical protein
MVSTYRVIVNDELKMLWKEAVAAFLKALSLLLPGATDESYVNLNHYLD